jgi:hypothetical protein
MVGELIIQGTSLTKGTSVIQVVGIVCRQSQWIGCNLLRVLEVLLSVRLLVRCIYACILRTDTALVLLHICRCMLFGMHLQALTAA